GATSTTNPFLLDGKVASFAPAAAPGGANVTINGTGFGLAPVVNFVHAAAPAQIVSSTPTTIVAKVPPDARNGPIAVTTPHNTPISAAIFKPLLKVLSFDQASYQAGHTVTVNGTNFLGNGVPTAKLGATPLVLGTETDMTLQFVVPDNGLTSSLSVTGGNGTSIGPTPLKIRPTITSGPLPNEAAAGTHVTITGKTFTGTTAVKFNQVVASAFVVGVGGTSLDVTVPPGAQSGPISVTNAGGTSTSATFTIDPRITSIAPTTGDYNTDVTVTGLGLTGVTAVKFNGIAGVIQPGGTATVLHVHAPAAGAISGHVTVWKSAASVQTSQDFTLLALSNVAPDAALPGQQVVLTGHGFTGATNVEFGIFDANFNVDNDGQITATVPTRATGSALAAAPSHPTPDLAHPVGRPGVRRGLALESGTSHTISGSLGGGTATDAFVEGTAAGAPAADSSAARTPDGTDTNDNSSDFTQDSTPTAGAQNDAP